VVQSQRTTKIDLTSGFTPAVQANWIRALILLVEKSENVESNNRPFIQDHKKERHKFPPHIWSHLMYGSPLLYTQHGAECTSKTMVFYFWASQFELPRVVIWIKYNVKFCNLKCFVEVNWNYGKSIAIVIQVTCLRSL
jgi:hypothetical protein